MGELASPTGQHDARNACQPVPDLLRMAGVATRSGVVRVLISDLPDLQADIVARLVSDQPDMVVVVEHETDSHTELDHPSADVILVARQMGGDAYEKLARLRSSADCGVLAIDAAHGDIMGVVTIPDDRAWPDKIIAAIRSAAPDHSPRHRRLLP